MTLLWVVSIPLKNVSIVDIFWGIGFIVASTVYFFYDDEHFTRQLIVFILVAIWGLRLSVYLLIRNYGKGEDFRYQEFRRTYGRDRYWWVSFFQVFLLQGVLIGLISLPLYGVHSNTSTNTLNFIDYMALGVWLIGFLFESVGDYQLARFKANPSNKGKVLDSGLWKYTRHPNYFGDATVWWAFGLFSLAAGAYWQIVGSLIMTYLIIKISGVALLEKSLDDKKPEYKDYVKRTNAFFPWFPKKKYD
ncbi:MAG: DUF1295 domain-containing protein [Flavobacteriaceae bacterium]|nr:DUF1295 domain-containing protein [Flavobacteriaceae bacterium]